MTFRSIRRYLPQSINGRAALILLVPILTLQMVVSIAFVQRYYEDISRQMTRNLFSEIDFFIKIAEQAASIADAQTDLATLSADLDGSARIEPGKVLGRRGRFDLAGRAIEKTLRNRYQALHGVDFLGDPQVVQFSVATDAGNLVISVPMRRFAAPNRHQLLVVTLFTGFLMAAISIQFLRKQMNPIRSLAKAADAFGKGRIVPYQIGGASEVRTAGIAFLDMRDRIEYQKEQRTLILTGVSHDLRTPLTRLKLSLSMLDSEDDIEATTADVDEMERLIDSFLDFARNDTTEQRTMVDINNLVRNAVGKIDPDGHSVLLAEMPKERVRAELRARSVERALANLVGNALRYGNNARVSVKCSDKALKLIVEDDGPGILPHEREKAIRPFVRLDPARNQNKGGGVGLGLAIVSDIAGSHGGQLVLGDSQNMGGLEATIVIPL